jgi:hypothetical protein
MGMTSIQIVTLVTAIVGAVCGICGAVLGVINTWSQLSRNRVRLKVTPKVAYSVSETKVVACSKPTDLQARIAEAGSPSRLCVEIVNLSAFAVTVSDVGFGKVERRRHVLVDPEITPGKTWPTRLEPREAVTLYSKIGEQLDSTIMQHPFAYARTDCGVTRYGTSPIFREYLDDLHLRRDGEKRQ